MTKFFLIGITSAFLTVSAAQAADMPEIVNCAKAICKVKTEQYVLKKGDSCTKLVRMKYFQSTDEIVSVNRPFGFNCATAHQGQIICRPIGGKPC